MMVRVRGRLARWLAPDLAVSAGPDGRVTIETRRRRAAGKDFVMPL